MAAMFRMLPPLQDDNEHQGERRPQSVVIGSQESGVRSEQDDTEERQRLRMEVSERGERFNVALSSARCSEASLLVDEICDLAERICTLGEGQECEGANASCWRVRERFADECG